MIQAVTFDTLPEAVSVGGVSYPVNFGYRAVMKIEIEMFGENNDEQKLLNALNIFYLQNIPPDWKKAVEQMLWFHRCGREEGKKRAGRGKAKRSYCFLQDAPLIYAAFRQQYGIDLRRTPNAALHWWEFSAMFDCLEENTAMAKVMYWRTCELKGMSGEQKKFIKKMRELHALKEPESSMDSKARLARRNAEMKAYVRKRMEECGKK